MDLFPTACEAAGVEVDHEIEGRSILPTFMGEQQDFSNRILYWVRREGTPRFLGLCQHAVRKGDFKLLHNTPFDPLELFHLGEDPREETDCSNTRGEAFTAMGKILQQEIQKAGGVLWQKGEGPG